MIPGNWREVDILLTKVDILLTNSLHGSLICVPFVRYEVTSWYNIVCTLICVLDVMHSIVSF